MKLFRTLILFVTLLTVSSLSFAQQDLGRINNFSERTLRRHYMDICLTLKFYETYRPGIFGENLESMTPDQAQRFGQRFLCEENGIFRKYTDQDGIGYPHCNSTNSRLHALCDQDNTSRPSEDYKLPSQLQPSELQHIGRMLKEFAEKFRSGFWDEVDAASQFRDFGYGNSFRGMTLGEPTYPENSETPDTEDAPEEQDPTDMMM